jgi:energy-coupling factor transporter ATP-binding protein EcfA2
MLSVARALMSNPELLLVDEPSLELAPFIVHEIYEKIAEIKRKGVTILLAERNVKKALEVANRGYVYAVGKISIAVLVPSCPVMNRAKDFPWRIENQDVTRLMSELFSRYLKILGKPPCDYNRIFQEIH